MANCPVCELRMVVTLNSDAAICPDHGEITGFRMLALGKTKGWRALVDIQADQYIALVHSHCEYLRNQIGRI